MAATRARCIGSDATRDKEASRLGARSATAHADTWRTFATAHVNRDGSGYVSVVRDGVTLHTFDIPAEV